MSNTTNSNKGSIGKVIISIIKIAILYIGGCYLGYKIGDVIGDKVADYIIKDSEDDNELFNEM